MRKAYVRAMPDNWWLKKKNYTRYIFREFTAIGAGFVAIVLLISLANFSDGRESYGIWLSILKSNLFTILIFFAFLQSLLQTMTWFAIAPKALRLIVNNHPFPEIVITLVHYALALAISAFVIFLVWSV